MNNKDHSKNSNLFCSFVEIWKFDKRLFLILVMGVVIKALLPFPGIVLSGLIIDCISSGQAFSVFSHYVVVLFAIQFALVALNISLGKIKEYMFIRFSNKIDNDINQKCLSMDYEQFNDSYFQDVILLINQMVQGNNYFTNISLVFETISQIITLVGIIAIITFLNRWLLIIAFLLIAIQSFLHIVRQKYNRQFQVDTISDQRKLGYMSQLPKKIISKKDIDIFNFGKYVLEKISIFQQNMLTYNCQRIKKDGLVDVCMYLISICFQISAYILIGISVFNNQISVGEFSMGVASLINFMSASSFVASNMLNLSNGIFYINKYKMFLTFKSKFDDTTGISISELNCDNIEIEFKNVSFRYPNSTSYVLKDINLKISKGERLALVGYNGAGKTSLTLLLTRMYELTEGEILINGINIKEIRYREYLSLFSTVNQDFYLFPFSIIENIQGANTISPEDEEKIKNLCHKYGLDERINKMYKGLDTPITKELFASGVDLSGGERQKIAILRALHKNSPILVMDEPTAALDPEAEHEIYMKFSEISNGKLTVYVSHRLNSTRFCEKIAVMDEGRIKEYGSYEYLMNKKGMYYSLFETQAELYK